MAGNVSIHLMLLFIGQYTSPGYTKLYRFNTSHVTLYPYDDTYDVVIHWFQYISCYSLSQEDESYDETGIVSIHLMLLFIITPVAEDWDKRLFQYISCYSLSVYVLPLQSAPSFQYISCYSLSSMCITMHNIFLFQYISCYSLSQGAFFIPKNKGGFNTSHVTLYPKENMVLAGTYMFQYISCYSLSLVL